MQLVDELVAGDRGAKVTVRAQAVEPVLLLVDQDHCEAKPVEHGGQLPLLSPYSNRGAREILDTSGHNAVPKIWLRTRPARMVLGLIGRCVQSTFYTIIFRIVIYEI
jgi:hypothetical protein